MKHPLRLNSDQEQYVKHAQQFWEILKAKDANSANVETRLSNAITDVWAKDGTVLDMLQPLLSHESEAVRYAAAAGLLNFGTSEKAAQVLDSS